VITGGTILPDFIIAGTQKAGTTWLEHNLNRHPNVSTPRRQIHFFDKNYERGGDWYASQLPKQAPQLLVGEKTTEYFDPSTVDAVFSRMREVCPKVKVILILRDPAKRALSAFQHMVNSGLEPITSQPDEMLFIDRDRGEMGFRYIERGFYAQQLERVLTYIPREQLNIQIFERDVVNNPMGGWQKTCDFLGIEAKVLGGLEQPVNTLRLSAPGIRLSRLFYNVPYARGVIRRIDNRLGLKKWRPRFTAQTQARLKDLYNDENERLFDLLGNRVTEWDA